MEEEGGEMKRGIGEVEAGKQRSSGAGNYILGLVV